MGAPRGARASGTKPSEHQGLTIELDIAELQRRREKFHVLEDGDKFYMDIK